MLRAGLTLAAVLIGTGVHADPPGRDMGRYEEILALRRLDCMEERNSGAVGAPLEVLAPLFREYRTRLLLAIPEGAIGMTTDGYLLVERGHYLVRYDDMSTPAPESELLPSNVVGTTIDGHFVVETNEGLVVDDDSSTQTAKFIDMIVAQYESFRGSIRSQSLALSESMSLDLFWIDNAGTCFADGEDCWVSGVIGSLGVQAVLSASGSCVMRNGGFTNGLPDLAVVYREQHYLGRFVYQFDGSRYVPAGPGEFVGYYIYPRGD